MCFSADASFTAGAVLALVGTLLIIRCRALRFLPLILIPWFFALQQIAEGIVWISFPEASFARYIFLFFAYIFWPIWVPFALWFAEKGLRRRQILAICIGIGFSTGFLLSFSISSIEATIHRHSISYYTEAPLAYPKSMISVLYGLSTIVPLFLSSLNKIWIIGSLVLVSALLIFWIDRLFFVSVWCFFGALISLLLFFLVPKKSK